MKTSRRLASVLLVIAFMLLACQASGATPTATGPTPAANGTAAPTMPPYTYISQENGVTVKYPRGWATKPPQQGDSVLSSSSARTRPSARFCTFSRPNPGKRRRAS